MNVIATYTIKPEVSDRIKKASIEVAGYERLMAYTLANTEYNIPQERADFILKKYNEAFKEYEEAKQVVTGAVSSKYGSDTTWNLDFDTRKITISK